jgi:hypothetical protein
MRIERMKNILAVFAAALFASLVFSQPASAAVDFGDYRSETLTTAAWKAMESRNLDDALTYANKCIEMYEGEARKMQDALKELPARETKEETFKRWALNDVGTCYFIKGMTLEKKGDKNGAKEAYKTLADDFKFSRCWDPKGWFWAPADVAKKKVVELEFDSK